MCWFLQVNLKQRRQAQDRAEKGSGVIFIKESFGRPKDGSCFHVITNQEAISNWIRGINIRDIGEDASSGWTLGFIAASSL